jgi:hypothetical protein
MFINLNETAGLAASLLHGNIRFNSFLTPFITLNETFKRVAFAKYARFAINSVKTKR